ncbi:SRPBCC family protein [uncultured Psychroserpens sp.]|uniref:SRPBCC family protein n=1 Tax=uncultured Psychroserpens sp. TaxID=255436 RepID=UPI002612A437|nr:SRPBCC family protein [uncultured Psychroserpens sp.]
MKYTCCVEIDLPIDKVVELWSNEHYFKEWQDGFQSIKHLSGTPNTNGAKSKITINGKQKIELIETIILSNLPKEKIALYEHIHMTNTQTSRFKDIGNNKTSYTSDVEYTKLNGFIIKLMAKLFPNKFKQQSQKWMNQFKEFAEGTKTQ